MSYVHGPSIETSSLDILIGEARGAGSFRAETAERFSDNHPFKKQAVVVLDALESVTNGMENPEVDRLLSELSPDSPFAPWRDLVGAIKAFYGGDVAEMAERLDAIPGGTPPKVMERLLLHLSGLLSAESLFSRTEREIAKNLRGDGGPVAEAFDQIKNALAGNNEAAFSDSAAFLVKELYGSNPDSAKRLALWALEQLAERELNPSLFRGHLALIFGDHEARRITALSLMDRNSEESLVAWIDYLIGVLTVASPKKDDVLALCEICHYLATRSHLGEERETLLVSVTELSSLFKRRFPDLVSGTPAGSGLAAFFASVVAPGENHHHGTSASGPKRKRERPVWSSPIQLDLFS